MTPSVVSSPRSAGRQCMKMACGPAVAMRFSFTYKHVEHTYTPRTREGCGNSCDLTHHISGVASVPVDTGSRSRDLKTVARRACLQHELQQAAFLSP